jgi:uncharacterized protein DUF1707
MDDQLKIRASDCDRQEVVDRLRGALADGRLKMDEFEDRVGLAYQAVTYGDLAPLHADLPAAASKTEREAAPPALAAPARVPLRGVFADLPTTLKVLWTIWLTAVSINVVVLTFPPFPGHRGCGVTRQARRPGDSVRTRLGSASRDWNAFCMDYTSIRSIRRWRYQAVAWFPIS